MIEGTSVLIGCKTEQRTISGLGNIGGRAINADAGVDASTNFTPLKVKAMILVMRNVA